MNFPECNAAPGISQIAPYVPGRTIDEVVRELGLSDVVKLASNENPLGTSPKATEAIKKALKLSHLYPEIINPLLQTALGKANGVDAKCIVAGNGADSILYSAALAFLRPGDEVLIPEITFDLYRTVALTKAAKIFEIPMPNLRLCAKAVTDRITNRTRMIFICNPNNPTGELFPNESMEYLLARLPQHTVLVHDEVYRDFTDSDQFPDLLCRVTKNQSNVILVRSMAKAYGLAGVRFGYGVMAPSTAELLHRVRPPFDTSILAQAAALGALEDSEFLQKTLVANDRGKHQLYDACKRLKLKALPSEANFVLVNIRQDAHIVAERLLNKGIIVRTLRHSALSHYLRISVGTEEGISRFVDAIEQIILEPDCLDNSAKKAPSEVYNRKS